MGYEEFCPDENEQPQPVPIESSVEGRLLFELTSFELAAANPYMEDEVVDGLKLLSKKAYHGSSLGHPFRNADSANIMETVYYDLPVAVIGTRPFTFTNSHNTWRRLNDAWEHLIDNIEPLGTISAERALRDIIYEFAVYPGFSREAAIYFAYSKMFPDAILEFPTFEKAKMYKKKYDDGRPISIIFSELLEMGPREAVNHAIKNGHHLSLDLLEIRNGVPLPKSISFPYKPTKPDILNWETTIDETIETASILRVKADPYKIERHRRESTNTARGAATQLNEMLAYIAANKERFKGLFIVDIEPLNRQYWNLGVDLNVVFQLSKHLEYLFQTNPSRHKPIGPNIVR